MFLFSENTMKLSCSAIVILLFVLQKVVSGENVKKTLPTLVTTRQGTVRGVIETTKRNTSYVSFRGIPFAAPPVGPLRFKDPVPAKQWSGILNATRQRTMCVQSEAQIIGTEDCLYLNVYTPDVGIGFLPVFVFIHGGGYKTGVSNEKPDTIIDNDFVTVMITYRLGVFGFLSLNTEDVPGNAGMKDQIAALKWVQENIRLFGGDPNNVSIFGMSAGGASTSLLQVSPIAKGLFQKVIATSGACLCGFAIQNNNEAVITKLAQLVQLNTTNVTEFVKKLRNIPAYELASAGSKVDFVSGNVYFAPVVEMSFNNVEPLLLKSPMDYIKSGDINHVPSMYGYESKDYLTLYMNNTDISADVANDQNIVPERLKLLATESDVEAMAYLIREHYMGTQKITNDDKEMVIRAIDLLGDVMISQPIRDTARLLGIYSQKPVYLYRFSFRGNLADNSIGVQGAGHGADMRYLFIRENDDVDVDDFSSEGWVRRRIIKSITNFCKIGDPTPDPRDSLLPIKWESETAKVVNYLEMNGDFTPGKNPDHHRTKFWLELEKKLINGELGL